MGAWYTIGLFAGLGTAVGIAFAAVLRRAVPAIVVAAVAGALLGALVEGTGEAVAGGLGGAFGALGASPLVAGTLRRGGTRGGTAVLLWIAAAVVAALAFVPVVGYVEALAVPALGLRLRRRAPERHAGLRTLAKD
jgi:hypothetical protein